MDMVNPRSFWSFWAKVGFTRDGLRRAARIGFLALAAYAATM